MAPQTQSRARNWVFTLNNWTQPDVDRITALVPGEAKYIIFGRESGANGTPHLQGFIQFQNSNRFNRARQLLGEQCHIEVAKSIYNAIEYCKKEEDYEEHGEAPTKTAQGKRTDIDEFKDAVKNGMLSMKELREHHSEVLAKYTGWCNQYVVDNTPPQEVQFFPLFPWQQTLYATLALPASRREIIFIVDHTGNKGKSWFARYYHFLHPETTQILQPGKRNDMAFILETTTRVLFMDAPRAKQGEYLQYDFLEQIKDGMVSSYKYTCITKLFPEIVHVVVLMNEEPDMTKLSQDRYVIVNI